MENNKALSKRKILLLVFSAILICVLGTVFGVTYAYVSGAFSNNPSGSDNSSSQNPFLKAALYYNNGTSDFLINPNGITGSVSANGTVSLKVSTTSGEKTVTIGQNSTFSLPIKVKNEGNVAGEVLGASIIITFTNASSQDSLNQLDASSYYLQFSSTNFTIQNNATLSGNKDIASGASVQLIDRLVVSDEIADSELCGLNFVITINVSIGQDGFATANAGV